MAAIPALADVVIVPEAGARFNDYVIQEDVAPVEIEDLDVGVAVPDAVELAPVPDVIITEEPELADYRYVYVGRRIAIVDPRTRRVVAFVR